MRVLDQAATKLRFDTRKRHAKACLKQKRPICRAEVHFGLHGNIRWQFDLPVRSGATERADEAGRPPRGEQLFRIGATRR